MRRAPLALAFCAVIAVATQVHAANPPGALDLPPSNVVPAPVDVTPTAAPRAERPADPTGNPLWAIPLSSLTATRERPIFLPSRRPPAPAVAGTPVVVAPPPPPPAQAEEPPLSLVGAIAGDAEGFAVFLDQATNNVVRLRTGQDHQGWVLRTVKGREVTLEKNQRSVTMALPPPNATGEQAAATPPPPLMMPGMLPRPGGRGMIPSAPGPTAVPPAPAAVGKPAQPPNLHPGAVGAPVRSIPGDSRPLEDQL